VDLDVSVIVAHGRAAMVGLELLVVEGTVGVGPGDEVVDAGGRIR
jgi:hypothetical protein